MTVLIIIIGVIAAIFLFAKLFAWLSEELVWHPAAAALGAAVGSAAGVGAAAFLLMVALTAIMVILAILAVPLVIGAIISGIS